MRFSELRLRVKRAISEPTLALMGAGAVALLALFPMVFGGDIPIAATSALSLTPWEEARPADVEYETAPEENTQTQRDYVSYVFISHAAREGQSLLWNPYENCGQPFMALWRTRCYSIFSLPFHVFSLPAAFKWAAFLKLAAAALCAMYAARHLGITPPLTLFVGVAFALGGPIIHGWNGPASDTLPWLPLLVLFADRMALGYWRTWPLGAVVLAMMLLGGDPEALAAGLLFAGGFLVLRLVSEHKGRPVVIEGIAVFLAAVVLAVGLAAVQIVPYVEFVREAETTGGDAPSAALRLSHFVAAFFPHFFGVSSQSPAADRSAGLLYVGLVQLLLLPLWFAVRPYVYPFQRQRMEPLLGSAVALTFLGFIVGNGLHAIGLGTQHLLVGNALAIALVGAAAAETWIALDADACNRAIRRFLSGLAALAVVAILLALMARGIPRPDATGFGRQALIAAGLALGFVAALAVTLVKPSLRLLGGLLAALAFVDLSLAFRVPFTEPGRVFPETPFITALKESGARVCGSAALKRWPLAANLVPQVYGTSGVELRGHANYVRCLDEDPLLLRRMGATSLLLTKADIQGPFAAVRPLLRIKKVFQSGAVLIEDMSAKPSAWMAYEGRAAGDSSATSDAASSGDAPQPCSERPPIIKGITAPALLAAAGAAESSRNPSESPAAIVSPESNTRVSIRVNETKPGVLVLADARYPGWKASVDGSDTHIALVDGLFRGVEVGQGSHEVVFEYDPRSVRAGGMISLVSGLVVLVGMAILAFRRRKPA